MSTIELAVLSLVVAALALASNVFNLVRGQQWRNTDDGKVVSSKIGALEKAVTRLDTKIEEMPTRADVATLTEVSKSNHELLLITRSQLNRMEGFFYEVKK